MAVRRTCPTCGRTTGNLPPELRRYLPFCCQRCQLIDLGRWFDEQYRIPGEPSGQDMPEPPEAAGREDSSR